MSRICPVCNNPVDDSLQVCPACGFRIDGTTQRLDPVNVIGISGPIESPRVAMKAFLHIVKGPQKGTVFTLKQRKMTLGRDPQCDIFLNDMTVSRTHAVLEAVGESYRIADDNSFNGVWVNGESVESKTLASGDLIQIGVFGLMFSIDEA